MCDMARVETGTAFAFCVSGVRGIGSSSGVACPTDRRGECSMSGVVRTCRRVWTVTWRYGGDHVTGRAGGDEASVLFFCIVPRPSSWGWPDG